MEYRNTTSEHIRKYRNEVLKNSSASTFDRKMFSLKKFFDWAVKEGYMDENPVEEFLKSEQEAIEVKLGKIEKEKKLATPSYNSLQARIVAKLAGNNRLQKLAYNLFYTRPKWYESYHKLPIATYFNYAILIILMSGLGFGIYNQFFKATSNSLAYPTTLTKAGRYLSFQGRLTNKLGNPITTATNLDFKLYNASQSGTLLWDSGTCPITPDTDGIFSTLLGDSCGSEISSSVFSENSEVWLGATVGVDTEATPRVQIATVAYALNSETLQGYPASESATANTVPVMNSSGQIVLAANSAKIQSTSGTFAIEGQAMTISTPDTSNGSITINPDGTGTLNLTFEGAAPGGSAGGFVNATNANITSGSLYYGKVASDATGYNLLQLASGSTPTDKFVVDSSGNVTAAGTINGITAGSGTITSGTWHGSAIGATYGGTGADNHTVAQYSIPYYSNTGVLGGAVAPSTAGYVLSTNSTSGAPTWIPMSATGTNYWKLTNGAISPFSDTLDVLLGNSATTSAKFAFTGVAGGTPTASISGTTTGVSTFIDGNGNISTTNRQNLVLGNSSAYNTTGNILLNPNGTGNVGIGTTAPTSKLYLAGGNFTQEASGNPTLAGTYDTTGLAESVYASGKYAYVADGTLGLQIIDISNPSSATVAGTYDTTGFAYDVYVSGKYAYVADEASGLQIIDISNPSSPTLTGTYDTAGMAYGVYVSGKYAYVADDTSGLQIINISNPSSPTLTGTYDTAGASVKVYVSGKYAYVGDHTSGLQIIDISNPSSPTLTGTYDTAGTARGIYVSGKYAYVADGTPGLQIVDISNPASPKFIGTYDTQYAWRVYVSGKYAYVADNTSGLQVINISNPASPTLVGTYNTPGTALGVYVSGKYAYVADESLGLQIIDINGAEVPSLNAGNIATNDITVTENGDIGNNLNVRNGINTGPGGLFSQGNISTTGTLFGSFANISGYATASASLALGNTNAAAGPGHLNMSGNLTALGNITGVTLNGTTGINTGATAGTQRIDASGNLVNIGNITASGYATVSGSLALGNSSAAIGPGHLNMSGDLTAGGKTTFGGQTYTWPTSQTGSYVLSTNGTGTLSWVAQSGGTNYWNLGTGTIYPGNTTLDLLLGSSATASAKFAFTGVAGGTPIASISGTTTGVATFLDGNGHLSATNRNDLILGNSSTYNTTGNILLNPNGVGNVGIGTSSPGSLLTLQSTATNESATLGNELLSSSGWTTTGWTGNFASGFTHTVGNTNALANTLAATNGYFYQISYTVTGRSSGTFSISFGGEGLSDISSTGTWGPKATSTGTLSITPTSDFDGTVVISIKQVTGTMKPTLAFYDNTGAASFEIRNTLASLANTFIGKNSGSRNTTGYLNTALGSDALVNNTTGYDNFAVGYQALYTNTTGYSNVAVGSNSLVSNTTGAYNVAIGILALSGNTTATNNVAIGTSALQANTTGLRNTAIGMNALSSNNTGHFNTAIGALALENSTDGYNTAVGVSAGNTITSGTYNTFLGFYAGNNASQKSDAVNSMAIGYGAYTTADNQVVIGNSSITQTLLRGNVGIGTNSPLAKLHISGGYGGNASLIVDQTLDGDIFTASASGQTKMTLSKDGTLNLYNATSSISNTSGDITINPASGLVTFSGANLGNIGKITAGSVINAGGFSGALFNALAGAGDATASSTMTDSNDLFVGGDVEIKGGLYLPGRNIYNIVGGISTGAITLASSPTSLNNYNVLTYGSWLINNSTNDGLAALMINQNKSGDLFSASSSGTAKFTVHHDGSITLAGMASTANTAEGTIYYDTDVDHLYLRGGDSAFHRLSMDMTQYSNSGTGVANGSYVEIAHNQNTSDLTFVGWVKNTITGLWEKVTDKSTTIKQSLQNEYNNASASGMIRTQTRLTNVELKPSVDTGTGNDGSITVSSDTNINTNNLISGRTCVDGGDAVNYNISSFNAAGTTATLSTTPSAGCLNPGDEVLIANLQGTSTAYGNVGNYETLRISSISTNTITFTKSKSKFYGDGATNDSNLGTANGTQRVILQRVPNYVNVTVNSTKTFSPSAWDGSKGGVMFFRATGSVSVSGAISANAKGYRNGASASYGGEAYCDAEGGGRGAYVSSQNNAITPVLCGGGGGAGSTYSAGGTGATGSTIGGAGGGGGRANQDYGNGNGGAGGGGGYGTAGSGGAGQNAGTAGGSPQSGNGGNTTGSLGSGGGGGGTYGSSNLSTLMFGSAGGYGGLGGQWCGSGCSYTYTPGRGGVGGGIIMISADTMSISGSVTSNGENGQNGVTTGGAGGGGGAGGSVKIIGNNLTVGSSLVTATGGTGGTSSVYAGGSGGSGRIAIYYANSVSGSSNPTASTAQQPYYPYGVYNSPVIPTTNAQTYNEIRWEATPSAYGKVEVQTRSGNSNDSTDGTWESWKPMNSGTNYVTLQSANTHTDWTGTNATVSDGSVTRNVDQYEDEDEGTAGNTTQFVNTVAGSGYMEATINSTDISTYDYLTAWVYATASGNTVKLGFGESAATEQEESVTIDATNTWQKVYWDLSDIPAASRNGVTKFRVTNLNNPWNTIHIDNIKAEKAITNNAGSTITSTPNNYFQYRAIFTTTNTSYQPQLNNIQFGYNNGYKIVQTDNNTVRLYNASGESQDLKLDVVVFGADLAEYYAVDDQSIGDGDVVAVTGSLDEYRVPVLRKSNRVNDSGLIGVISTKAGQTLGIESDSRRLLALAGRVPVKIASTSRAIAAGDALTSSDISGRAKKASLGEQTIGTALESWNPDSGKDTILILVGNGNFLTPTISDLNAYILTAKVNAEGTSYQVTTSLGDAVEHIGVFSQILAANIKAGTMITKDFVTEKADVAVATIQDLTAPKIATNLISPLPGKDLAVELPQNSKFKIQDSNNNEVASIDSSGSATINNLTVNNSASVSGTLYADDIKSKSLDEIKKLLTNVETDQNLLKEASGWNVLTSTNSASLEELAINDLYVTNRAAVNSLSVTNSLAVGTDMVFQSTIGGQQLAINSIDTLSSPLQIQSLAMAPVEIMAGLIKIDTSGNVQIAGNLTVAGKVESSSLDLISKNDIENILSIKDATGSAVATINASGSANFASISTQGLTIAGAVEATNSAVVDGIITTNATAGSGVIPQGISEITIKNKNVTNYTLVYVTPTSSTDNYVLYVKSKKDGEFVVGFTNPISVDVNFNWWIVKVTQ